MDNALETRDYDVSFGSVSLPGERLTQPPLEVRREGFFNVIRGFFPYNSRGVIADRGPVRKEEFAPGSFDFAVNDPEREITLLYGHTFNDPVASKHAGNLNLQSNPDGLAFEARLPDSLSQSQRTVVDLLRRKLIGGLSPGFRIPPVSAVAEPVALVPERPGVSVRRVKQAVLYELSFVTRPVYKTLAWLDRGISSELSPGPFAKLKATLAGVGVAELGAFTVGSIVKSGAFTAAQGAALTSAGSAVFGAAGAAIALRMLVASVAIGFLIRNAAYVTLADLTTQYIKEYLGGDAIKRLREVEIEKNRVRIANEVDRDDIIADLSQEFSLEEAEYISDLIVGNNLAVQLSQIESRSDPLIEKAYRWL